MASRAAVLASLLPANADHDKFLHVLGIHGDPVAGKRSIDQARRTGVRVNDPYKYERAFNYALSDADRLWYSDGLNRLGIAGKPSVLDPTAGGGSIPFEAVRLGCDAIANDLNSVAAMILRATAEWPLRFGNDVCGVFNGIAREWRSRVERQLAPLFPQTHAPDQIDTTYLWARTIQCPYCNGIIPLSPNWRLAADGTGIRLKPNVAKRVCEFEIVSKASEHSTGTVNWGNAQCPYPDCGRIVDDDIVRACSRDDTMGEQLFAIIYKRRLAPKSPKARPAWERGYRAPTSQDDISSRIASALAEKLPEWEARGIVPTEPIPPQNPRWDLGRYGLTRWTQLFSPRQLFGHATSVEIMQDLIEERRCAKKLDEAAKAAFAYLALGLDKLRDYNSRMTRWHVNREVMVNTFDRHDFAFKWSYAEMALLVEGMGYDWAIGQVSKCIEELIQLLSPEDGTSTGVQGTLFFGKRVAKPSISITNKSGESLDHISDASIDAVVMDPPYHDNVMYAELSDFFYVWLKRTAGIVYPEFFRRQLTDKENEAVASVTKFQGQKNAKDLADRDYQQRMAGIFAECRRVLKPDGILTVMFTHKATGAWDALASGLLEAGFTITASWPINTEAEGSLHIKDKAAANSTIFLVCRPRPERPAGETHYWEDVEPLVAAAVRKRIEEFEKAGIRGVDLYLSCFGPALEEFAKHWPLTRGQPRPATEKKKGRRKAEGEAIDPYAVVPEDALEAARREVKKWRLDRILRTSRHADLDPMTEWFVLAWDAFEAPQFPYDEALRLARVVGLNLDSDVIGKLAEKKASEVVLWDSSKRAAKGALGPSDGSRALIDALHHAAHRARTAGLQAAREQLETTKADQHSAFTATLTAVLEVLPVSSTFTKIADESGPVAEAASDFDALEHLRRLAYSERVREPEQLKLWTEGQT